MKRFQIHARTALFAMVALSAISSTAALAAPADGIVDTTFGTSGRTIVGFNTLPGAPLDVVQDTVVDSFGRTYLVGVVNTTDGQRIGIARLRENGTLDTNYGPQDVGLVVSPTQLGFTLTGVSAALDASGRLLVGGTLNTAGNEDFAVCRFDIDGALNAFPNGFQCVKVAFDLGGTNADVLRDIVVQTDGKIVMAGSANSPVTGGGNAAFARLNTSGNLDSTFNGNGKLTYASNFLHVDSKIRAIKMTTNGKIVGVGEGHAFQQANNEPILVRLLANGSLDASFGLQGQSRVSFDQRDSRVRDLALIPGATTLSDDRIVGAGEIETAAGSGIYDGLLLQVTASGGTDGGFGTAGIVIDGNGSALTFNAMQREDNGNLTIVGTIRANSNPATTMDYYITRFLPNGTRDTTNFNPGFGYTLVDFFQLGGNDLANAVAFQSDRIIIAGTSLVSIGPPVNLDFSAVALLRDRIFAHGFE